MSQTGLVVALLALVVSAAVVIGLSKEEWNYRRNLRAILGYAFLTQLFLLCVGEFLASALFLMICVAALAVLACTSKD